MIRYVALPAPPRAASWLDDYGPHQAMTCVVHDTEPLPQKTGILDSAGVPLYRVIDKPPIGFKPR